MMRENGNNFAGKTIAVTRIVTGIFFLFFAEYKVAGPAWAYGGFEKWIRGYVDGNMPVGFYKPILVNFALVHPVLCARMVAWGELAIGLSLVLGLLVRPASIAGAVLMINMALATWFAPGHDAPAWQYIGANLDHLPLLLLFAIFFATRAGEVSGVDGRLQRSRQPKT
jgi:thiosulfate dehydrogenase [quinone] large subunit